MQYKLTAERIVYPARQRLDHRALAGASGDNILKEIGKVTDFVISLDGGNGISRQPTIHTSWTDGTIGIFDQNGQDSMDR